MLSIDPRLSWRPPIKKPTEDPFMNDMEREFVAILAAHQVPYLYEPRFYYLNNPQRPQGNEPCGYCPDLYLIGYGVFVEIYNAEPQAGRSSRAVSELIRRKRQRIQLLSRYSALGTVLVTPDNMYAEWEEFQMRIDKARIRGMLQRLDHIQNPIPTKWEV